MQTKTVAQATNDHLRRAAGPAPKPYALAAAPAPQGFGTDAFTRSAAPAPADRRPAYQSTFDRVADLGAAGPEARLDPAAAEALQLRLDNVKSHFGDSDVSRMTWPVTSLLWRVRHGETGPELTAAAIATKLDELFAFYEARQRNLPRAYAQVLDDALVNAGRALAKYPPVLPAVAEASPEEAAVEAFRALDHNGDASRAIADELVNVTGTLATSSYAFGARGDALRTAMSGLAMVGIEAQNGVGVPPVEVAEHARGALAGISEALVGANEIERKTLQDAAKAIMDALGRGSAGHRPMTAEVFWAEQRATEAKAREAASRAATAASRAAAEMGAQVAAGVGGGSPAVQPASGVAAKAVTAEPAEPHRLLLGIPGWKLPAWMSFQNVRPAFDLAATQVASVGGPIGAGGAAAYGVVSRLVPADW